MRLLRFSCKNRPTLSRSEPRMAATATRCTSDTPRRLDRNSHHSPKTALPARCVDHPAVRSEHLEAKLYRPIVGLGANAADDRRARILELPGLDRKHALISGLPSEIEASLGVGAVGEAERVDHASGDGFDRCFGF